MRKVIVSNLISLDGFYAGPAGEIDWFVNIPDTEFEAYGIKLMESIDTMLFGRVTYELMAAYWPTASPGADDQKVIDGMNRSAKVVFSRTLKKSEWNNTRLVAGDAAEEVARLKRQPGKDMVIYGSGEIVSALASKGLIDDYRIFVIPVVLGKGKSMFAGLQNRVNLKLMETRVFQTPGVTLLRYVPSDNKNT